MSSRWAILLMGVYTLACFAFIMHEIWNDSLGNRVFYGFGAWLLPMIAFWFWGVFSVVDQRFAGLQAQGRTAGFDLISQADEVFLTQVAAFGLLASPGGSLHPCVALRSEAVPSWDPWTRATRAVFNLMRTQVADVQITYFEYIDRAGSLGIDSTGSVFQCLSPGLRLPRFSMRPASLSYKCGRATGDQEFPLASSRRFSKLFRLYGPDEASVAALFSDPVQGFFEDHPCVYTEGEGNQLVVYGGPKDWFPFRNLDRRVDRLIAPTAFDDFLQQALQVHAAFAHPAR